MASGVVDQVLLGGQVRFLSGLAGPREDEATTHRRLGESTENRGQKASDVSAMMMATTKRQYSAVEDV